MRKKWFAGLGCLRLGSSILTVLGKTLDLEILCHCEKRVELLLGDVDLALVHELEDRDEVVIEDALEVEQGMLVGIAPQDGPEEGGAGGDDDLVRLHLAVVAHQRHVKEVLLLPDGVKC